MSDETPPLPLEQYDSWMHERLGAPRGIVNALIHRDTDWERVIKLHAFIESALNQRIVDVLGRPELSLNISHLETSNTKTGKAAFARSLGIISDATYKYIRSLSELRNEVVHDARNLGFHLRDWWRSTKKEHIEGRNGWRRHFTFVDKETRQDVPPAFENGEDLDEMALRTLFLLRGLKTVGQMLEREGDFYPEATRVRG
jgi:hypothetical protein